MSARALSIDLAVEPCGNEAELAGVGGIVLIEPLYAGPATALAFDSGWSQVELAEDGDGAPIPLVSFTQPATDETCRVRSSDAVEAAASWLEAAGTDGPPVLLASMLNARPLCSLLMRSLADSADRVLLVPVRSRGELAADAWWIAGALIRVLLDEAVSSREVFLGDMAGVAVALASDEDGGAGAVSAIDTGMRFHRHLERGGAAHDAVLAAQTDSVGSVPRLAMGDAIEAVPWQSL